MEFLVQSCETCGEFTYGVGQCCLAKPSEIDTTRCSNDLLDCLLRSTACTVHVKQPTTQTTLTVTANAPCDAYVDSTTTAIMVPCVVVDHPTVACCVLGFERRWDTGEITHVIIAAGETKTFETCFLPPVLVSKACVGKRCVYSL